MGQQGQIGRNYSSGRQHWPHQLVEHQRRD